MINQMFHFAEVVRRESESNMVQIIPLHEDEKKKKGTT